MINKKTVKKIPAEVLFNAHSKLDEARGMLEPYFVELSPPERQSLVRIEVESFKILELTHKLAVEYPELFPTFTKAAVFEEEFFTIRELWTFDNKLDKLKSNIGDTEMAVGSHTLDTAMAFYNTVKIAARHDIPGAKVIFEELKPRFPPILRRQYRTKVSLPLI